MKQLLNDITAHAVMQMKEFAEYCSMKGFVYNAKQKVWYHRLHPAEQVTTHDLFTHFYEPVKHPVTDYQPHSILLEMPNGEKLIVLPIEDDAMDIAMEYDGIIGIYDRRKRSINFEPKEEWMAFSHVDKQAMEYEKANGYTTKTMMLTILHSLTSSAKDFDLFAVMFATKP